MIAVAIILALLILLMLTKVGGEFVYEDEKLSIVLSLGLIRYRFKPKGNFDYSILLKYVKMLWHALVRLLKGVVIEDFHLRFIAASDDPYKTAMLCGSAYSIAGMLAPHIRRFMKVKKSSVEIDSDFLAEKSVISASLRAKIPFWKLLIIAGALLREYLQYRKTIKEGAKNIESASEQNKENDSNQAEAVSA